MANDLEMKLILSAMDRITAPLKKIRSDSSDTIRTFETLNNRLAKLHKEQQQISKMRGLYRNFQETQNRAAEAQQEVKRLAQEISRAGKPTRELSRQFDKAKKAASTLTRKAEDQHQKIRLLRTEMQEAGINTRQLAQHEQNLRRQLEDANHALTLQEKKLERIARADKRLEKLKGYAGRLALAGAGTTAAGLAINKPVMTTVSAFARAEESATQLKVALMRAGGIVPPEFEKINALAIKLGDRLPGTTSDFQDMMTMLNRQGIQATTILDGMGEAAAYLGVLLKKTPRETAEFAAKLQDATRTTERDMLSLMDVIQRTFYLGVDDNNMLEAFSRLSPAMDTIRMRGLNASKALAPLLVMADQSGLVGGQAGNAFRKVFQLAMNKEKVDAANKLMGKDGQLDFTDGKGEFGGLENLFAQFAKLESLNTQRRESIITKIFGDDAETKQAISIMISKGLAGYREVQQKMADQATLEDRVNVQLDTLHNLWEATTGTFTNVLVALGESIAPELKAIVTWLGKLTEAAGKWVKEHPVLAGFLMKTVAIFGLLLTATGGLMLATAAIIGPYALLAASLARLGMTGGILLPVLRGIGQAILFIGRALLTNPIGLAIIGIALAAFLIYRYWEPLRTFVTTLWHDIRTAFSAGIAGIETYLANWSPISLFYRAFSAVLNWFGIELPARFTGFGAMLIDGLLDGLKERFSAVLDKIRQFGASIAETFQAAMGIHSPSRLFAEYGRYLTEGLAIGIHRGQQAPILQIRSLASQIGKAASGIQIGSPSGAGILTDHRPPIFSNPAPSTTGTGETRIDITINPAPGMDAQAIARAVAQELDRREREKNVRRRSRYTDYQEIWS